MLSLTGLPGALAMGTCIIKRMAESMHGTIFVDASL